MTVPEHSLNVRSAPTYHPRGSRPGSSTGTLGLAFDGGAWQTLAFPATGGGWATTSTTISLIGGYNVIRLAMGAPFFTGGSRTINQGYLQLS
jgi:hypothetical protein